MTACAQDPASPALYHACMHVYTYFLQSRLLSYSLERPAVDSLATGLLSVGERESSMHRSILLLSRYITQTLSKSVRPSAI
jgi:hypothetical protein